jgi:hypothetical protein
MLYLVVGEREREREEKKEGGKGKTSLVAVDACVCFSL